jgi:hypothetical protein
MARWTSRASRTNRPAGVGLRTQGIVEQEDELDRVARVVARRGRGRHLDASGVAGGAHGVTARSVPRPRLVERPVLWRRGRRRHQLAQGEGAHP